MEKVTWGLMLLPLIQLVTVPISAASRNYSAIAWFIIVMLWLAIMFPVWIFGLPMAIAAALALPILGSEAGAPGVLVGGIVGLVVALFFLGLSFGPAIALRAISPKTSRRPTRRRRQRIAGGRRDVRRRS